MKRRRLVISLFLIAAIALLGIGYSAVTHRLDIDGSISSVASTDDFKVHFVDATLASKPTNVVCEPGVDATGIDATMNISGLSNNGEIVIVYFKVQNKSKALDNMNALVDGLAVVVSRNDVPVVEDSESAGFNVSNVFTGSYIRVDAEFHSAYNSESATGDVSSATAAVLEAPTTEGADDGEFVWVMVKIEVIGSFTAETVHSINVHFNATSDATVS